MDQMPNPTVSIGMPVHNGAKVIRGALDSLLAQSFADCELIISDNASTDATETICREYAARDSRIRYVRQNENLGPAANFQFVLNAAVGEYFMWAACDDLWNPNFVSENLACLRSNPAAVASILPSANGADRDPDRVGCAAIIGLEASSRIAHMLRLPGANVRFYSLFRRAVLQEFDLREHDYLGNDWSLVMYALTKGQFMCCAGATGFHKSEAGQGSDVVRLFDSWRRHFIEYLFPFLSVSRYATKLCGPRPSILFSLLRLNYQGATSYWLGRLKRR